MQTKHLCVLIHIWTKGEVGAVKQNIFTDRSKEVLPLWIICVIYVLCLSCLRVCSLLPCGHLQGKGWPLGSCLWCLIVLLLLSHVVSWVRCGSWLYWFLIIAPFLTLIRNVECSFKEIIRVIDLLSAIHGLDGTTVLCWGHFSYTEQKKKLLTLIW